jgi:hypothetical protein
MIIMHSMSIIGIITALTIAAITIVNFGFILATAQTATNNTIVGGDNTTSGGNNTGTGQVNQTGSIAGIRG